MRASRWAKKADRLLGVPMVAMLGALRRRRRLPERIERIGVLKENAIGDTVVLAAALADVRRAYPRATITLFTGPSNAEFARLLTVPDHIVRLPIDQPLACVRVLRAARLDLLFDAGQWPRINAILCALSGALYCVGFRTAGQHRHYAYDATVEHRNDVHEVENFRALVARLHPPCEPPSFGLRFDRFDAPVVAPYAVVHMWPGGERSELKEWPPSQWRVVIDHLQMRGLAVVLTGAPSDRPRNEALMASLADGATVHNAAGSPLAQLPSLLLGASVVVSVNTGLMHLAGVLEAPTVGLHGPTSALRWGPRGSRSVAVSSEDPQAGYLNLGFEYPPLCRAMQRLPAQKVIDAMDRLLEGSLGAAAVPAGEAVRGGALA